MSYKKLSRRQIQRAKLVEDLNYVMTSDGFVWEIVSRNEALDLFCMSKDIYHLHDDETESLCTERDFESDEFTYGIEIGFYDDLIAAHREADYVNNLFKKINDHLGLD
jgi:hypothetical protein